ncbi:TonB-dependent receptor [Microbulbifer taiwanensis]|uniref:TonB-dependent receptor n=1 Tax=Microbulbifer taiwanensis TaxID=986746 RepID=UPI00361EF922
MVQSQSKEARDRQGYQVTVQWEPTDRISTTFNYIGAKLEQNNDQNLILAAEWDYRDPAIVPGSVRYDGDTIVAMDLADADLSDHAIDLQAPAIGSRRSLSESKSDTYDLEVVYEGDGYTASANVGHTESSGGTSFNNLQRFYGVGGATQSYGWDLHAGTIMHYDAEPADFNGFGWRSADAGTSSDEEFYAQVDFNLETDWGIFESFDMGAKYRDHEIGRRFENLLWDDGDPNNATLWGGCCGLGYEYWHTDANLPSAAEIASFIHKVKGLTGEAGTEKSFLSVDWDAYTAWLDDNFIRSRRDDPNNFFNINEEITAAYLQGNFNTGALSGNLGLRLVQTEQRAETFDAPLGIRDEELDVNAGSYTDVLPSFNLKWEADEDLIVRAAASRVVARVGYGSLGASEGFDAPPEGSDMTTGSRGNPDLEPYDSTQFDLGAEWYFRSASVLGAAVFHKEIDSFVTMAQTTEKREVPNRTEPVDVIFSLPVNGTDATSTGLELFYQHAFDFGGGVIANYTYTDTSLATLEVDGSKKEIPLPGTSEHQYNLSAYYETDKFSVRASYNFRDDFAGEQSNGQTVYTDGYGQVDVNGSYYFTDALVLNVSAINLTKEVGERYWGSEDRLYNRFYTGRRFYMGLNYKF